MDSSSEVSGTERGSAAAASGREKGERRAAHASPVDPVSDSGGGAFRPPVSWRREEPVVVGALGVEYPAPKMFDGFDDGSSVEDEVVGRAPWWDTDAIEYGGVCDLYCRDGLLPTGLPLESLRSYGWRNWFSCRDSDLRLRSGRSIRALRADFARKARAGLDRLFWCPDIPVSWNMDMFIHRTRGEVDVVDLIRGISGAQLARWKGCLMVDQAALCFAEPQIRVDFRYVRKTGAYWMDFVRGERRARSNKGLMVPYQCVAQFELHGEALRERCVAVTPRWTRVEVPRGCNVELPPIFSYKSSVMQDDPDSGWWVVAYTQHVAKTASFILMDAYDQYRLWALSSDMIRFLRELDLLPVLGNEGNVAELLGFLSIIESTEWERVDSRNRLRGVKGDQLSYSPGRVGPGGDFVGYDPWRKVRVSHEERSKLVRVSRPRPAGHPVGWDFTTPIPAMGIASGWGAASADGRDVDMDDCDGESCPQAAVADGRDVCHSDGRGDEGVDISAQRGRYTPSPAGGRSRGVSSTCRGGGASSGVEEEAVRSFLRSVGVDDDYVRGASLEELRGYVRGRFGGV